MASLLRTMAARGRDPAASRRAGVAWHGVSALALAACAAGVIWFATGDHDLSRTVALGGAGALILVAALAMATFGELGDLSLQHARDLKAQAIYDALGRGETPPPYVVYLRPFSSTDQVETVAMSAVASGMQGSALGFVVSRYELEQQIERATRHFGPLVCLGQSLEHVGAGRIAVDEASWKDAVLKLCEKAALIVMLPSSRAGTLWEIEHVLASNLIDRTVFVDPPNAAIANKKRYDQSREWRTVREAFAAKGFTMPPDSRVGRLLFFGTARAPTLLARLDIDAEDNIARFFRSVIRIRKGERPA
ncbi:MAG: hypothetical protein KJS97_08230 [Alphaproteobacteria bacterium]|nr:hypothetical protein [Alphaproteobacteria bacterium]